MLSYTRRISDPIHNILELTSDEDKLINTNSFQRLRNIKQLGLVHYVFPAADFSRLSHSLGVCHTVGKILSCISQNQPKLGININEVKRYRIAGLLHDIGHYPFSHTMEDAINKFYKSQLLLPKNGTTKKSSFKVTDHKPTLNSIKHEEVGESILKYDTEVAKCLKKMNIEPEEIYQIFKRERVLEDERFRFTNIISSDLDADRIDYLLRSSHVTNAPYGATDIHYLLHQIRVDREFKICVTPRALKTVDHFLLGRYFDYQQVIYQRTVAGLEKVLENILFELLKHKIINCEKSKVLEEIKNNRWHEFDDNFVLNKIKELRDLNDTVLNIKIKSLFYRKPPKLVFEMEYLEEREEKRVKDFSLKKQLIDDKVNNWAKKYSIDRSLWYVLELDGKPITKVGSRISISDYGSIDPNEYEQSMRIYYGDNESSRLLMDEDSSLMKILANKAIYILRVYVLFPDNVSEKKRTEIITKIKSESKEFSSYESIN